MICYDQELERTGGKVTSSETFRVNQGTSRSTGHLWSHLESRHKEVVSASLESSAKEAVDKGKTIDQYMNYDNLFVKMAAKWCVNTYQPLSTFDQKDFREMIAACSSKSGKYVLTSMLSNLFLLHQDGLH
jgi:hypothetical protein